MTVNVSDWSETPASNTTIDGTNIDEGCPPGNVNNVVRSMAAGMKTFYLAFQTLSASIANLMPKAGGTFSGTQPNYASEGAFLHHSASGNTSGRVSFLPDGSALPSGANGDVVFFYTP